jgi:hypothetical protein
MSERSSREVFRRKYSQENRFRKRKPCPGTHSTRKVTKQRNSRADLGSFGQPNKNALLQLLTLFATRPGQSAAECSCQRRSSPHRSSSLPRGLRILSNPFFTLLRASDDSPPCSSFLMLGLASYGHLQRGAAWIEQITKRCARTTRSIRGPCQVPACLCRSMRES